MPTVKKGDRVAPKDGRHGPGTIIRLYHDGWVSVAWDGDTVESRVIDPGSLRLVNPLQ